MKQKRIKKIVKWSVLSIFILAVIFLLTFTIPVRPTPLKDYKTYGSYQRSMWLSGLILPKEESLPKGEYFMTSIFTDRTIYGKRMTYHFYDTSGINLFSMSASKNEEDAKNTFSPNGKILGVDAEVEDYRIIFFLDDVEYVIRFSEENANCNFDMIFKIAEEVIGGGKNNGKG